MIYFIPGFIPNSNHHKNPKGFFLLTRRPAVPDPLARHYECCQRKPLGFPPSHLPKLRAARNFYEDIYK